jgi:hypothetical protein
MPDKIAQPEVRRWYAAMLIERHADDDRDKARTLLGEAIEMYRTIRYAGASGDGGRHAPAHLVELRLVADRSCGRHK